MMRAASVQCLDYGALMALMDLVGAALNKYNHDSDAMEAADQPDDDDVHDRDPTSEEGGEYEDEDIDAGDRGRAVKVHRAPSRLARTTFADDLGRRPVRERLSRLETLMMAFEADFDAMDTADDDMTEDSSGLSKQPSDAVDDEPTDAADRLQAAARAQANVGVGFTAAGQSGPGMMPPGFTSVQFPQPVPHQPQANAGMQQQPVDVASNLQVAPLAVPPLHTGPSLIDLFNQQVQVQLQQQHTLQLLFAQQPEAMQMLMQQPALLGPAGILLQGQMMNARMNPAAQLRDANALVQRTAPANPADSGVDSTNCY
jgi:hypothetical protein